MATAPSGESTPTEIAPGQPWYRQRDFVLFQASRLPSILASQMQSVAVGWQVYGMTHRPLDLGLVGLAQFLPPFCLALVTGHVADRFDRRRILGVCHALLAVCAVLLFLLARASSGGAGGRFGGVGAIYCVLVLVGATNAFRAPAGEALLPHLVTRESFPRAVALSSTVWQVATIAGPAVGGVLYGVTGGASTVYAVCATFYALASLTVLAMRFRAARVEPAAVSMKTLLAGIRYVIEKRIILGSLTLNLFAVLLGGAVALLPIYARDILHVGPFGLGLLRSAPAVGASVMALALARWPMQRSAGHRMFICVALFGVATVVFGLSTSFTLSLVCLVITGAADMVSVVVRQTVIQIATPPDLRGRVSAVNQVFIGASSELGEFESGVTAAWFGTVPAVVFGGIGTCVVVALCAWLFPSLRKVDRLDGAEL